MDYTTLVAGKTTSGSIANWVNRSDLPTAEILAEAQAWVYQRLRVREMQSREAFSFTTAGQTTALPSGFLDPISFTPYGWGDPLEYVDENGLHDARDEDGTLITGTPSRWTVIGDTAYVDVKPTETFSGLLLYYKQPTALGSGNTTNFLTTRYPSVLRHACMSVAYQHMKDTQRTQEYATYGEMALQEAMRTNDMYRRGQTVLRS